MFRNSKKREETDRTEFGYRSSIFSWPRNYDHSPLPSSRFDPCFAQPHFHPLVSRSIRLSRSDFLPQTWPQGNARSTSCTSVKIKSSIRGRPFSKLLPIRIRSPPRRSPLAKGRGVKAVITSNETNDWTIRSLKNSIRRGGEATLDIRRGRIPDPPLYRPRHPSLSLSLSLLLTLMVPLHLQRTGGESRAGRRFSLMISTCPQDPRPLSFIQSRPVWEQIIFPRHRVR